MTTYTVECRSVYTIHKQGCVHLQLAGRDTYDFDVGPGQDLAYAALVAFNGGDEDEGQEFAVAPCVGRSSE